MYWSVVWCSGGCRWKCPKTLTFCSLLKRCTIPCACHAKRHLNLQKWREHVVLCTFWLGNVLCATTACTFSTSQLPKVVRSWCVLYILTSKCASRHNAVHFFVISTSKTAPNPSVFNTFYFQTCFAPQRRALFQHLNFQKWSDPEVFWTFSLRNRLRATTACNFSSLISPDVSAPAALASLLFNPPEPQNHEKTQCFPASSFFWSFLFWLFSLLTAFSSLHIVGSLTSKLPFDQPWLCGTLWYCVLMYIFCWYMLIPKDLRAAI